MVESTQTHCYSILSYLSGASLGSLGSLFSIISVISLASTLSTLAVASTGSVLSVSSVTSVLSVCSVNCAMGWFEDCRTNATFTAEECGLLTAANVGLPLLCLSLTMCMKLSLMLRKRRQTPPPTTHKERPPHLRVREVQKRAGVECVMPSI